MKTLQDLFEEDRRARTDSRLQEQDFRNILSVAAPVFKEMTARGAFPVSFQEDWGVTESAHIEIQDVMAAQHGMSGTGGTFDRIGKRLVKKVAYPVFFNLEVPARELASARRGGFDLLRESGRIASESVVESENKMLISSLGAVTGLTATSGIQTFASAGAWTTAGIAWQDITKALGKLGDKKVPRQNLALLVNPLDEANLYQTFSNTDATQLGKIQSLLPGGIHASVEVTEGKAYVYAKTPTVVEYVVYQDLRVVPLPKIDEDERMRLRVVGAMHVKKADGVVEITSVNV